jgi:hypothetical protein
LEKRFDVFIPNVKIMVLITRGFCAWHAPKGACYS